MATVINGTTGVNKIQAGAVTVDDIAPGTIESAIGSPFSFRNKLINGNFDIWQRGTSFTPGIGTETYVADRWFSYSLGAATTISITTFGTSNSNALIVTGAAGNTAASIWQRVESTSSRPLSGKPVTFSGWIYSSTTITPSFNVYAGNAVDVYTAKTGVHSGSLLSMSGWTYFSVTIPELNTTAALNGFQIGINFTATGAGVTRGVGQLQLEEGLYATKFEQRPIGLEMSLCQRYYEQVAGTSISTRPGYTFYNYMVTKRVLPSLTLISGGMGGADYQSFSTGALRCPAGVLATSTSDWTLAASAEL